MKKQRKKTKGAFGSSINNHILQDLRMKVASNQMVAMALVDHFKINQLEVDQIVREFVSKTIFAGKPPQPPVEQPNSY